MLKVWKQTWKEKEASRRSLYDHDQDSDQDVASGNTSSMNASKAGPSDTALVPVSPPSRAGSKRPRKSSASPLDFPCSERPIKLPRTIQDPLRNQPPEVLDSELVVNDAPTFFSSLKEQILDKAKRENIIAIIPCLESDTIFTEYLTWAIEVERTRFKAPRRIAFIVVEDDFDGERYHDEIKDQFPGISVGWYEQDAHEFEADRWEAVFMHDVVIAFADLLLNSLLKGVLAMPQLHTLMIDHAQNIKDQDSHSPMPIVRVMGEFYQTTVSSFWPRIFALAALPNDLHFDSEMLKLELILDAKVFGMAETKRSDILSLPDRPKELVIMYNTATGIAETRLSKQLHQFDPDESIFPSYFRASRHALLEVGPCAQDLVWRRALKEIETLIPSWYNSMDDDEETQSSILRAKQGIRDTLKNWPFTMPNLDPSSKGFNVTHKFRRLVDILMTCGSYGKGFRGIIFVQKRAIALVLVDLFRNLYHELRFIRPCALFGHSFSDFKRHQEIFHGFVTGEYNLLVATKSTEDLEIPRASMVIRYDLFDSQTSHAYAKARTCGRESHLIHMVERGNDMHHHILSHIMNAGADILRWTEALYEMANNFAPVPPRDIRESINPYHSDSDDEDSTEEYITDPTTSGRIYIQDATTVIYRFTAGLKSTGFRLEDDKSLFDLKEIHSGFGTTNTHVCSVTLPGTVIDNISGSPSLSKSQARRSACFEACRELSNAGLLDYRMVPLPPFLLRQHNGLPVPLTDKDERSSSTRCYPRKYPNFWANSITGPIVRLCPVIVSICPDADNFADFAPILILTRRPLPHLEGFKLFSSGISSSVRFQRAAVLQLNDSQQHLINQYTNRVFRAILNKPLTCSLEDSLYFIAPLTYPWSFPLQKGLDFPDVSDSISWDLVNLAALNWAIPIRAGSADELVLDLKDAVVQDRWVEFTRRYNVNEVRRDMTPLSKPDDSPREADYESLLDFCKARRKGFEGLKDYHQPIIQVERVSPVENHLDPTSKPLTPPSKAPAKYLIPELCAKFTLPASTLRTALLLPSIMRRIDDLLIVKELNARFFDHAIREDLLHVSLCAPSAGLEYNYERLELLGDAFLKYLCTIYVFVAEPTQNEGSLHIARQKLISNKSLLENSNLIGLPVYIQAKPFPAKSWQPPNFRLTPRTSKMIVDKSDEEAFTPMILGSEMSSDVVEGAFTRTSTACNPHVSGVDLAVINETSDVNERDPPFYGKKNKKKARQDEQSSQWLGDKAVADVVEAIIGAAYISGGRETALQVTKALAIPISNINRWSDFGRNVSTPPPDASAKLRPESTSAIERIIGHNFQRPHLLAQALTHSSMQGHESASYGRLEFIGDAILDFMVIQHIFNRDQTLSPGALTLLKGAMVSNSALAAVCVSSGLRKHLLFESYQLAGSIEVYANELKARQQKEYLAAEREGRSPGQYWLGIEPPKALSDVVESIIGAIYISDDFTPIGAERLFNNVLKPFYDKHITLQTLSHHPTKILFELFQAQGCHLFEISKENNAEKTLCHVLVHEVILASAEDVMPTLAARQASIFALDALQGDAEFMRRICDCRTQSSNKKPRRKSEFEEELLTLQ